MLPHCQQRAIKTCQALNSFEQEHEDRVSLDKVFILYKISSNVYHFSLKVSDNKQ